MQRLKLFGQALITYIVVDIAYQIVIGFPLMKHFVESSPLKDSYIEPTGTGMALMLVFFGIIAFANVVLAIEPALKAQSARSAAWHGAILGAAAYATLGLTNGWSLDGFPILFSLTITIEGILFSSATSGLTTWWWLRSAPPLPEFTDAAPLTIEQTQTQPTETPE